MNRLKKGFVTVLCVSLLFFAFPFNVLATETAGDYSTAKAHLLLDATSNSVISQKSADLRLPIASTTKVMTALITLEQPNLDEVFTVDKTAIMVEGTSMGLREGDSVTLRTLAVGMLLPSGNDAANAAAVRISGSIKAFAQKMNERASEIGMKNTSFVTPSGLDSEEHYSTAFDMALLARTALQNKAFAGICGSKSVSVKFGSGEKIYPRSYKNHNKLLSMYEGCIGVKTGFTKKAGRCLVSAATRDGVTLICVTLNDGNDWDDHKRLFDYGFKTVSLHENRVAMEKSELCVVGGELPKVLVMPTFEGYQTTALQEKVSNRIFMEKFLYAPVYKGDIVGYIEHSVDGVVIAKTPIAVSDNVPAKVEESKKNHIGFFEKLNGFFKKYLKNI